MTGMMLIGETQAAKWTAEEDATLVRMLEKGASATQVGIELGRSRNAVCGRIHRKNLQPIHNVKRAFARAARLAKPKITRTRFSPDEDKIIIEMSALGKSGSKIGAVLNRNESSVIQRARLLGANLHAKAGPEKSAEPKPPKVKAAKQHLHAGNIASKKESRAHDPGYSHVTPVVAVAPLMVALVDLGPSMCRFPVGDPREEGFGFCGHLADGAYCWHHAALCYTAPEDRRRAA